MSGQQGDIYPSGRPEEGGEPAGASRGAESGRRGIWLPGLKHSRALAASMAPQRKSDFSQIVLRALCTGTCVSLVNACVAGECRPGRALIF